MARDKVFLVAPAIKTKFWKEFYRNVMNNDCEIELIFVGHHRPNFKLPPNFHYIYSEKSPVVCAEIAYNKAYEIGKDTDFIQNTADDCLYSKNHFDKLISAYREEEAILDPGTPILCGPASYNGDVKNLMALFAAADCTNPVDKRRRVEACIRAGGTEKDLGCSLEGPSLPTGNFSTILTSKQLGGINTTFEALYWDCDQAMVCHSLGGKVVIFEKDRVEPVVERRNSHSFLYSRFGIKDFEHLNNLWDVRSYDGKNWNVKRK
tara:strand:- start:10917 stop:11705 length:789 start_codon:yes stop_codon:yes gene_type:complete